jgi:HSP20 family protein
MLADMLRDPQATPAQPTPAFTPAADILETAEGFELHLALPGVKKESVNIEVLDGELVIAGERNNPAMAAKEAASSATEANADANNATDNNQPTVVAPEAKAAVKFRRVETNYGSFRRSFRLPKTVNVKGIGAELTDGILRVVLPFDTEKVTKQHIEIR